MSKGSVFLVGDPLLVLPLTVCSFPTVHVMSMPPLVGRGWQTLFLEADKALLQSKQVSATELAQHYLARMEGNSLNAFNHVDAAFTLQQAAVADQRIATGDASVLTGIPIAHKDIFVTRHLRSTAGSKMLENYVSPFDATVVEHFNAAGMVTLGKLNCDEFAMGSSNENSYFGAVKNPWDIRAIPGGSSGTQTRMPAAQYQNQPIA